MWLIDCPLLPSVLNTKPLHALTHLHSPKSSFVHSFDQKTAIIWKRIWKNGYVLCRGNISKYVGDCRLITNYHVLGTFEQGAARSRKCEAFCDYAAQPLFRLTLKYESSCMREYYGETPCTMRSLSLHTAVRCVAIHCGFFERAMIWSVLFNASGKEKHPTWWRERVTAKGVPPSTSERAEGPPGETDALQQMPRHTSCNGCHGSSTRHLASAKSSAEEELFS